MPNKIIKDGVVVEDDWILVPADGDLPPTGKLIVPLSTWQNQSGELSQRQELGVWLDSDESPAAIVSDLNRFAVIAIHFPAFADGRGFSYARELRQTHGYTGELRAIGGFMRDQLFFLKRCGFNAFALENTDLEQALNSLNDFSDAYQSAPDQPLPLFRRR